MDWVAIATGTALKLGQHRWNPLFDDLVQVGVIGCWERARERSDAPIEWLRQASRRRQIDLLRAEENDPRYGPRPRFVELDDSFAVWDPEPDDLHDLLKWAGAPRDQEIVRLVVVEGTPGRHVAVRFELHESAVSLIVSRWRRRVGSSLAGV